MRSFREFYSNNIVMLIDFLSFEYFIRENKYHVLEMSVIDRNE